MNVNRDGASGFRLDTLATHRLHRTPALKGQDTLTTYTDYVSKYPATISVTSYNLTATKTTAEHCAGVVKASGIYPKNPAQHAADLQMLEDSEELHNLFYNPESGNRKAVECVRVDGAAVEGPSHHELQFFWTARHLEKGYYATVVTSRSAGQSFLNRVEPQNGCLSLAHSNLFIPSTLNGSNLGPSGKLDCEKHNTTMQLAMDVYISRVSDCPCEHCVRQAYLYSLVKYSCLLCTLRATHIHHCLHRDT